MVEIFLAQAISIFAIIDPIGVSAILLSLAHSSVTKEQINQIALKSTLTIIVAFFVVLLTGDLVLKLFSISIESLKVMGGIVLLMTGLKMVNGNFEKNQTKEEKDEAKGFDDFTIIPLAIPITFGPGIFATIVIYKAQASSWIELGILSLAFLSCAFLVYLAFKYSIYIKKLIGITGQKIATRLMGLIVGAIAVQFILSGTASLWLGYTK